MNNSKTSITGWGFPPGFGKNGSSVDMVSGEEDIRQSLEIILSTAVNERLNYPDFGGDLNRFLFEEADHGLAVELENVISDVIYNYEPRIDVERIEISESEETAFRLLISVDYVILETETFDTVVYSFNLYS